MPTFYGPPSDGTVIPEQLETALAEDLATPGATIGAAVSSDGQHRKQAMLRRKGGSIGTGGRGVVALRFDHHNPEFQANVLPLLKARGLPYTHAQYANALSAEQEGGYTGDTQTGMTWAQVQAASINAGGEIFSHSWTHADASGLTELTREIIGSRDYLEQQMPELPVEGFIQPGIAGGAGVWDGFDSGFDNPDMWRNHLAGRLIRTAYGVYSGTGSYYNPLTGDGGDGIAHYTLDTNTTSASGIGLLTNTAEMRTGLVFMLHPRSLDFGAGYITTAVLVEILDKIVELRDAGRILPLTMSGLACATPAHSFRQNLGRGGALDSTSSAWGGTTGWTIGGGIASGSTSAGSLARSENVGQLGWAGGGAREVSAEFRAPTGATVRVHARDFNTPTLLDVTREVTLPASEAWVPISAPFILPMSTDLLRHEYGRVSGGAVELRKPGVYAI